jgi:integrase
MRQAGSVVKKRKRYYIVYCRPDGQQKWKGGFETKGQAQAKLTEVLGQMHTKTYFEPVERTSIEFADAWLENRVSINGSTWQNYKSYLDLHVKPFFGASRLTEISHAEVQQLVTHISQSTERPLSANTVRKITTMLSTLFKSAIKNNLIRVNPARELELPKVNKPKIDLPDKGDVLAILEQAPADLKALFILEVTAGLRRREILALQWQDVDWFNEVLQVWRAIVKAKADDGAHAWKYTIGPPKSGKPRTVGLAPEALNSLVALKHTSRPESAEAWIFPRNGTFCDPGYFTKRVAMPLIKRATQGRVKRFHDLRHFFVSGLGKQGADIKYVQEQVGHASIKTTMDTYGHIFPESRKEISAKLGKWLSEKPEDSNVRTLLEQSEDSGDSGQVN